MPVPRWSKCSVVQRHGRGCRYLSQLRELEEQSGIIEAAAAHLAAEQGLSEQGCEALRLQMLARVREKAQALREKMAMASQYSTAAEAGGQPTQGDFLMMGKARRQAARRVPPGIGPLDGILSRASPRGAAGAVAEERGGGVVDLPNPIRGKGTFNPSDRPTGAVTAFDPRDMIYDSAGVRSGSAAMPQAGSAGAGHDAHLRIEHHKYGSPEGRRHMHSESKVSFGGNARILYPSSDVMVRGKYPGY